MILLLLLSSLLTCVIVKFVSTARQAKSAQGESYHVRTKHFATGRRRQRKRNEQSHDSEDQVSGRPTHVESRKRGKLSL